MASSERKSSRETIYNLFRGFLIGIANIIPGVSGGTFALILGIYERLINALANISPALLKSLNIRSPGSIRDLLKRNDLFFLLELGAGAVAAIILFSWIIDYSLTNYTSFTLAFFLGLVVPSISVPYHMMDRRKFAHALFIVPGIAAVLMLDSFSSVYTGHLPMLIIFLSGILAVSAMILPGISGSFLLLVIGVYHPVIRNIKLLSSSADPGALLFLSVFAAGCAVGFVVFVRIMKYLLLRFRNRTYFFLIGLVAGSLAVLWPFKEYDAAQGIEFAIRASNNTVPGGIMDILPALGFFAAGFAGWRLMESLAKE